MFPQVFYCVCADPGCPWSEHATEVVGADGTFDERVQRIPGSSYSNTCVYYRVIVFEAVFIRVLRERVRRGVVSLAALPEVLDHLLWQARHDPQFWCEHGQAIRRITSDLYRLERDIVVMNGHLVEIARIARNLVFCNRALLHERCEPRYWPSQDEVRAAVAIINRDRDSAIARRNDASFAVGTQPVQGHAPAGRRVA